MKARDAQKYAEALDEIGRKVAAGEMSEGEATVWRQRLTKEMSDLSRPPWQKLLIFAAIVVVGFIVLQVIF